MRDEHFSAPGFDWFTPGDFCEELYLSSSKRQLSQEGWDHVKTFPPETVMMIGIGATIGKVAISRHVASCNQQINGIILNEKLHAEFFAFVLRSLREFIVACGKYTTLPILDQAETKSIPIMVPPIAEQKLIVQSIFFKTGSILQSIARAQSEIVLIREYRTRLISDVVTGKLDVRHLSADIDKDLGEPVDLDEGFDDGEVLGPEEIDFPNEHDQIEEE